MRSFPYVEDYLEILAGVSNHLPLTAHVSLARYDNSPISSFVTQSMNSVGLTDRQAILAVKLVAKYERQLAKLGISLGSVVSDPKYRIPLRKVDRTHALTIDDGHIRMRFPFDNTLIERIKKFAQISDGKVKYVPTPRVWEMDITESCVNFAVTLGKNFNFTIDPELEAMYESILELEQIPYQIHLVRTPDGFDIENAAPSLRSHIEDNLGGFGHGNLRTLLDYAPVLQYTVDPALMEAVEPEHRRFVEKEEINITPVSGHLDDLVSYAREFDRSPIISYHSGTYSSASDLNKYFAPDEILNLLTDKKPVPKDLSPYKLVHMGTNTAKSWPGKLPLVVCYTNMMFGSERSLLLQSASKVCYYCDTFYKKD